jgi:hypothetical protein
MPAESEILAPRVRQEKSVKKNPVRRVLMMARRVASLMDQIRDQMR